MNEFREWLSDNLRYFMLGFAIILVIALLFFGTRFISKALGGNKEKDDPKKTETTVTPTEEPTTTEAPTEEPTPTEVPTEEPTPTEAPTKEPTPTEVPTEEPTPTEAPTEEPTAIPTPEEKLKKDSNEKASALVRSYYSALGKRDVKALAGLMDHLEDSEASKIEKEKTIESYQVLSVYTKKGPADGSYAVLAEFEYKLKGIDTQVPSLSALFVKTDAAGKLYIAAEKLSEEEQDFFDDTVASAEAQKLVADVTEKNKKAVASDKKLQDALAKINK